jgi:hypothetical protein
MLKEIFSNYAWYIYIYIYIFNHEIYNDVNDDAFDDDCVELGLFILN